MTYPPPARPHSPFAALALSLLLILLSGLPACAATDAPGAVYFDERPGDTIVIGNSYYEIAFRKWNGSIAAIKVKPDGQSLTLGSRKECLWGAMLTGPEEFVGGCHYGADAQDQFSYQWLSQINTLILKYEPLGADGRPVGAEVQVRVTDARWFDLRIEIRNYSSRPVDRVLFPCDLAFREAEIKEAVLPILPGMALEPAFWAENRSYVRQYPGWPGLFADLVSLSTQHGALSIYPLPNGAGNAVTPAHLGFVHDEEYAPDSTFYHHTFGVWTRPKSNWLSPWVRLMVGGDWLTNAPLVREHTGLTAFPSLSQKLGDRFDPLVRLPLYKADAVHLDRPFEQYAALFDRIAYPGLLHPVAWQPGGHDENYPDLLPPDPKWGTTADMAAMFRAAQARGFQVMPYSNPTWWDDRGATLLNLPPGTGLADVAVIQRDGTPFAKPYDWHTGYVVSPWSPFVIGRVGELVDDLAALRPDWQLWDQVGGREWPYDFNKSAPTPTSYMTGWLKLSQTHAAMGLMTEMGYDHLAETMIGFHGSALLLQRQGDADLSSRFWRPVPLASALLGDKVLLYQHDLAPETMTHDKETLTWNLANGYMLSADLAHAPGGVAGDWLTAVATLQRYAVSRYAGRAATGYELIGPPPATLSRTYFGPCSVLANWDNQHERPFGLVTLTASGVHVQCQTADSGSPPQLTAGLYTRFNSAQLASGDHVIIEERGRLETVIRHPLGPDTLIVAAYPAAAYPRGRFTVEAFGYDGASLGATPATAVTNGVRFVAAAEMAGQRVEHYRVRGQPQLLLPLFVR